MLRVKKTIKLAGVVVIGAAVGFMLWKMLGSVPIILWAAVLGVIPTLIGIEMTFKPPATPKAKGIYRIIFGIWAIATCVLAYLQYKRDEPQIPNLPQITIETFPGLPEGMTNNVHFRFNRLSIRNANDVAFENLCSRLQLPEPIYQTMETDSPPGTVIDWHPIITKATISGTGTHSVLGPNSTAHFVYSPPCFFPEGNKAQLTGFFDNGEKTGIWELTADKLPPHGVVSLLFLTSNDDNETNYITFVKTAFTNDGAHFETTMQRTADGSVDTRSLIIAMIVHTNKVPIPNEDWHLGSDELRFSFEGLYQYPAAGKLGTQHFLLPLAFDAKSRALSSLPIQPNDGKWKRVTIEFQ